MNLIDVVVIGSGLNYYKRIAWEDKTVEINEFTYNIDRRHLFIVPTKTLRFLRRRNIYKIVFKEGDPEAVTLPPSSRKDPPSDILFIAERSDALKKGLEDLFRTTILSRKVLIFIFVAVGILAFAFLYATGRLPEIKLPSL